MFKRRKSKSKESLDDLKDEFQITEHMIPLDELASKLQSNLVKVMFQPISYSQTQSNSRNALFDLIVRKALDIIYMLKLDQIYSTNLGTKKGTSRRNASDKWSECSIAAENDTRMGQILQEPLRRVCDASLGEYITKHHQAVKIQAKNFVQFFQKSILNFLNY